MNNKFKTILAVVLSATAFSVFSCTEIEDPTESNVTEFVVANTDIDGTISVITNDRGNSYIVLNDTSKLVPDTIYRIVCNYTLSETNTAKINAAYYVYSDPAKDMSKMGPDEFGNDPVTIKSIYVGGGYLNIYFGLKMDGKTQHSISSVRYDSQNSLTLGISHNANGDTGGTTRYGFMSIPLRSYSPQSGDTIYFKYNNGSTNKTLYSIF